MDKKTEKARVRKKIENDRHKKKYRHMNTDRDRLKENGLLRKIDTKTIENNRNKEKDKRDK